MTDEERVGELMQRLRRCFRFIHHRADGGKGSQARILRVLHRHGEMTQRHLQEHMNIQQSSLSELVKKMEDQALLQRTVCPEDRRQIMIRLTQTGKQMFEENEDADLHQNIGYLQVLTEQEQLELLALLTKLDTRWSELYSRGECGSAADTASSGGAAL